MVRSTEEVQSGETSLQTMDEFQSPVFGASLEPGPVPAKANVTGYTTTPGVQGERQVLSSRNCGAGRLEVVVGSSRRRLTRARARPVTGQVPFCQGENDERVRREDNVLARAGIRRL